jgi:hypothetical protein
MFSHVRSVVPLIRKCALLLLAFLVFGFGLQARLAQYKSDPPNPTSAKISTEKHSLQVLAERNETPNPVDRLALAFFFSGNRMRPTPQPVAERAEIGLSNPTRFDLNGVYSLHRPPPTVL